MTPHGAAAQPASISIGTENRPASACTCRRLVRIQPPGIDNIVKPVKSE
jgi:hypothetical protein